jgi:PPOX class probable FMN-dependent enzyme
MRLAGLVLVDSTPFVEDNPRLDRLRRFMLGRDDFASVDEAVEYARGFDNAADYVRGTDRQSGTSAGQSMRHALRRRPDGRLAWKYDRRHVNEQYFQDRITEFQVLTDCIADIGCPTLVLHGGNGRSLEDASRFAALLPTASLATIDDAGHNVHRDNPVAFVAAVRSFFNVRARAVSNSAQVTSREQLRSVYRPPAQRSLDKEVDHLDVHCRDFIAHAPFVLLATAGRTSRVHASPRGGPPGFVSVLDEHRFAIPDMSGNNRLDSLSNVVDDDRVGLLFMVPGLDETLRVNGRATITTDPWVLDRCQVRGLRPNVAVVVDVEAAYIHCAKALRRAGLWNRDSWPDLSSMATPACMLRDHIGLDVSVEESQRFLDESYAATTWKVGGD